MIIFSKKTLFFLAFLVAIFGIFSYTWPLTSATAEVTPESVSSELAKNVIKMVQDYPISGEQFFLFSAIENQVEDPDFQDFIDTSYTRLKNGETRRNPNLLGVHDPDFKVRKPLIRDGDEKTEKIILLFVYGELQEAINMAKSMDSGGYDTTHALLGIYFAKKRGRNHPALVELENHLLSTLTSRIKTLIKKDRRDLLAESILVLLLFDRQVKNDWITIVQRHLHSNFVRIKKVLERNYNREAGEFLGADDFLHTPLLQTVVLILASDKPNLIVESLDGKL